MKSIALVPGKKGISIVDRREPSIQAPDEIKMQVVRVGICGTDREEAAGGRAMAPVGSNDLVIGHEMFGKVVEVGKSVRRVKPGDYAVFTVRRGCGKCLPCAMNRSDMCETGEYTERGIWGRDGYQTEYVVDKEQYVVHVPEELESIGVLCEPLSIAEKAIHEALHLQSSRLPDALATPDWLVGRRCLVAGLGPVGLLAALALRLRGATVYGMDIVGSDTSRPQWLAGIGGKYIDGREVSPDKLSSDPGPMDLIFEAAGQAELQFNLLDSLSRNGIYMVTGIPGGDRLACIHGAEIIRGLVLSNQIMAGSVNASRGHFQMAVDDLAHAHMRWGDHIAGLITRRNSYRDASAALEQHPADEIKSVVEWASAA